MARAERGRTRTAAALLGLALLAGLAFLVGALAGLVWKEPGLLVAYLRGETTDVAWTTASTETTPLEDAALPAPPARDPGDVVKPLPIAERPAARERTLPPTKVAATAPPAKPAAAKPAPVRPKPAPEAAPARPTPPPVAAAPPRISIQVGAFAERSAADRLSASLESDGYPAYVVAGAGAGGSASWRVRVGPYETRDDASTNAQLLKRTHALPTWVVDENAE